MEDLLKKKEDNFNMVIFTLGKEQFGVDVKDVREVLTMQPISPLPKTAVFIEGVINLRGHVIGVVDLRKLFDLEERERTKDTRIMIARIKKALVGLIVDSVLEVTSMPKEVIEPAPEVVNFQVKNNLICAVAKKDNKMTFIINLDLILDEEEIKHLMEIRGRKNNA